MKSDIFISHGLFVVLVLYNTNLKDSETYKSIVQNNKVIKLKGIIYDNSQTQQNIEGFQNLGEFEYVHNENNPGLAFAYNYALKLALEKRCKWLLLLDQDTFFTEEYFDNLNSDSNSDVVAYTPIVKSFNNKQSFISPSVLYLGGFRPIRNKILGIQKSHISGINSGTIINCNFMESIGGFNLGYPLDILDHWYYREVYRKGKFVEVLNSEIYQNLSVEKNFEKNVSLNRYSKLLKAEYLFFKTGNFIQYFFYKSRLILRSIKQSSFNDRNYYKLTLKTFFHFGK
ncbi:glycosyltransferase [Empedobacter sp.]|nr:glycosyltransferase [Empedobacter sp.]